MKNKTADKVRNITYISPEQRQEINNRIHHMFSSYLPEERINDGISIFENYIDENPLKIYEFHRILLAAQTGELKEEDLEKFLEPISGKAFDERVRNGERRELWLGYIVMFTYAFIVALMQGTNHAHLAATSLIILASLYFYMLAKTYRPNTETIENREVIIDAIRMGLQEMGYKPENLFAESDYDTDEPIIQSFENILMEGLNRREG